MLGIKFKINDKQKRLFYQFFENLLWCLFSAKNRIYEPGKRKKVYSRHRRTAKAQIRLRMRSLNWAFAVHLQDHWILKKITMHSKDLDYFLSYTCWTIKNVRWNQDMSARLLDIARLIGCLRMLPLYYAAFDGVLGQWRAPKFVKLLCRFWVVDNNNPILMLQTIEFFIATVYNK